MENEKELDQLAEIIIETIREQKPQNLRQVVNLVKQKSNLDENDIVELALQLENEGKITLSESSPKRISTFRDYVLSSNATWFWITMAIAMATLVTSLTIPEGAYPLIYIRQTLGIFFILMLPGYTFLKVLFPSRLPIKTSQNLEAIERIALSIGMSLALVPLVGLLLNYTPWGITLAPIIISLLALTLTFSITAMVIEYNHKIPSSNAE